MARVVILKNVSGSDQTYNGQLIPDTTSYTLQNEEYQQFKQSTALFVDIAAADIVVNDGTNDITDPTKAWDWLVGDVQQVEVTQTSELGNKIAVHSSPKPTLDGVETYAVWAGSGDKLFGGSPLVALPEDETLGTGDLLQFSMVPGTSTVVKDTVFDPRHGRVWIHEAYLKYNGAGLGDSITADVMAPATLLQQSVNLDYNIVDDWLIYAGPGAGTHGLAGTPVLVPRSFSKDGDWDFDGTNLTPNFGTGSPNPGPNGGFKITTKERGVHRYINRVPLYGETSTYFTLSSDESAELPINLGYFLRVTIFNGSNDFWTLSAIMEIYRERTIFT